MEAVLDDEMILSFRTESLGHLATLETGLRALSSTEAPIDDQRANRLFRAAHSIKGGAGFFELAGIRDLAQHTERVLDLMRFGEIAATPQVIRLLLRAVDAVRQMLADNEGRISGNAPLLDRLQALASDHLPPDERHLLLDRVAIAIPEVNRTIEVSAFDLRQAQKGGQSIYWILCDLIHDIQRRNRTPWEVFQKLIENGTILETIFDLNSAGTLADAPSNSLMLEVLYATSLPVNDVRRIVEAPPERLRQVELTPDQTHPAKNREEFTVADKSHDLPAVLVVDDSMFLRKRVRQLLPAADYAVVEAENGECALHAIERQTFSCILTDLVMPVLDGFELLEELQRRQLPAPVVVVTADVQQSTRDRCKALGAFSVLQKPIDPEKFRAVLATILKER